MEQNHTLFEKLCKLLPGMSFSELMANAPMLASSIPELAPMVGFDQHSPHHAYDLFTHTAHVTAAVGEDLSLRWAALLHDIGKVPAFTQDANGRGHFYGHARMGAQMADAVLRRMEAPEELRGQVVTLIDNHMTRLKPEKESLGVLIDRLGWETVYKLLLLQKADMASKGVANEGELTHFSAVQAILLEMTPRKEETI